MENRLYLFDGEAVSIEGDSLPAMSRFRLLYDSPESRIEFLGFSLPEYKIFEFVTGAKLCGKAKPGEGVEAHVKLLTPSGEEFDYVNTTRASQDGRFCLRMPYACGANGEVLASAVCLVKIGKEPVMGVKVSEGQVENGETIFIP